MKATEETRNDAYAAIKKDLNRQQVMVFEAIRSLGNDASIGEIANYLNWEKSTVSARVNELRNELKVIQLVHGGKRRCNISHIKVCTWKVIQTAEQLTFLSELKEANQ